MNTYVAKRFLESLEYGHGIDIRGLCENFQYHSLQSYRVPDREACQIVLVKSLPREYVKWYNEKELIKFDDWLEPPPEVQCTWKYEVVREDLDAIGVECPIPYFERKIPKRYRATDWITSIFNVAITEYTEVPECVDKTLDLGTLRANLRKSLEELGLEPIPELSLFGGVFR